MKIEPLALAEFDLVEVKTTNSCPPTPHCKKHGAMNKITADGIWRCITVSGYRLVKDGKSWGRQHAETICRAGCAEVAESAPEKVWKYAEGDRIRLYSEMELVITELCGAKDKNGWQPRYKANKFLKDGSFFASTNLSETFIEERRITA